MRTPCGSFFLFLILLFTLSLKIVLEIPECSATLLILWPSSIAAKAKSEVFVLQFPILSSPGHFLPLPYLEFEIGLSMFVKSEKGDHSIGAT